MNKTKIEWCKNQDLTNGFTSNPIKGKCHHNCIWHGVECYAETIRKRYGWSACLAWHPQELEAIRKRKKPATIFVGSMYDIFGDWVDRELIQSIINMTHKERRHTILFLTKNPKRYTGFRIARNAWLGITITKSEENNKMIYSSFNHNNFVSYEPLLGEIKVHDSGLINWVIIGSLNKAGKPISPEKGGTRKEWALSLIEQADKYNIPVFVKSELYQLYPDLPVRKAIPYLDIEEG